MLSIAKARSRDYLIDLAKKEYYLEGGEPPGRWYGRGALALGLEGEVSREAFKKLWDGYSPDGKALVQNAGRTKPYTLKDGTERKPQRAWDFTFSAPKSVSVLWAITDDPELRKAIQRAHEEAVRKALDYLEREAGLTRTGEGGHTLERAQLIFACFEHGTSRAQEPQLHTHCLAFAYSRANRAAIPEEVEHSFQATSSSDFRGSRARSPGSAEQRNPLTAGYRSLFSMGGRRRWRQRGYPCARSRKFYA